jgi:hypothetical protein
MSSFIGMGHPDKNVFLLMGRCWSIMSSLSPMWLPHPLWGNASVAALLEGMKISSLVNTGSQILAVLLFDFETLGIDAVFQHLVLDDALGGTEGFSRLAHIAAHVLEGVGDQRAFV